MLRMTEKTMTCHILNATWSLRQKTCHAVEMQDWWGLRQPVGKEAANFEVIFW